MLFRKIVQLTRLFRMMGPSWVAYRIRRILEHRLRLPERRMPVGQWEDEDPAVRCGVSGSEIAEAMKQRRPLPASAAMLHAWYEVEAPAAATRLLSELDDLRSGRLRFFSGEPVETGWPPAWNVNAVDGNETASVHFSRISTFGNGDIKNFWESGRFGFVTLLARAHARGIASDAPALFWQAVEDFARSNPPMCGVQHLCGQETAIRSMMWIIGWSAFGECQESTDARLALLWSMLAANARRIEGDIAYALSQKNNHGVSEAAGLFITGLQLPEHPRAQEWLARGQQLLEQQLDELVYDDGGFSQHSANYHRIMLQAVTFAVAVAKSRGHQVSQVSRALKRSAAFLHAMIDDVSGGAPRYGNDDGASIMAWTDCGYDDFRPAVQEAFAVVGSPVPYSAGVWDEGVCWLTGQEPASESVVRPPMTVLPQGGMAVLRQDSTMVCLRVPNPLHRTTHLDTLHVDLWWRGINVALDPGTYRYNAAGRWNHIPLARDTAHNVIGAVGTAQAEQLGRFLFAPWPRAQVLCTSDAAIEACFTGPLGAIDRWKRDVHLLAADVCCIVDHVAAAEMTECELRWHLPDVHQESSADGFISTLETRQGPLTLLMAVRGSFSSSVEWLHGDSRSHRGWYAPRYGQLAPCHDVVVSAHGCELTFLTVFSADGVSAQDQGDSWTVTTGGQTWTIPQGTAIGGAMAVPTTD